MCWSETSINNKGRACAQTRGAPVVIAPTQKDLSNRYEEDQKNERKFTSNFCFLGMLTHASIFNFFFLWEVISHWMNAIYFLLLSRGFPQPSRAHSAAGIAWWAQQFLTGKKNHNNQTMQYLTEHYILAGGWRGRPPFSEFTCCPWFWGGGSEGREN